jgi:hypothetical protein
LSTAVASPVDHVPDRRDHPFDHNSFRRVSSSPSGVVGSPSVNVLPFTTSLSNGEHAAQCLGNPPTDRETDSRASLRFRIETSELLEKKFPLLRRDAAAGVGDVHGDPSAGMAIRSFLPERDRDVHAPLRRVLDRVGDEIAENLANPGRIASR